MKKVFSILYVIAMISSAFACNTAPEVVEQIKTRSRSSSLDWVATEVNPAVEADFRQRVEQAISGNVGALRMTAFLMQRGVFQNEPLFKKRKVDPAPYIQDIAILAFANASDESDDSSSEAEDAAIDVLKECCPEFSQKIGLAD